MQNKSRLHKKEFEYPCTSDNFPLCLPLPRRLYSPRTVSSSPSSSPAPTPIPSQAPTPTSSHSLFSLPKPPWSSSYLPTNMFLSSPSQRSTTCHKRSCIRFGPEAGAGSEAGTFRPARGSLPRIADGPTSTVCVDAEPPSARRDTQQLLMYGPKKLYKYRLCRRSRHATASARPCPP